MGSLCRSVADPDFLAFSRPDGTNALHSAVSYGRTETVRWLLEQPSIKRTIDRKIDNGETAVVIASRKGHDGVLRLLLHAGAKAGVDDASGMQVGLTPLHRAAINGHERVVRMLVNLQPDLVLARTTGARLNEEPKCGSPSLIHSCSGSQLL